jgi:titin
MKSSSISGKPSTPVGPLDVSNVTEKSATVSWKAPESDGGLPLTGYLLEVRDSRRTAWKKVADLKPSQTSHTVPDLDIGNDYFFRVTAINKEGSSSPLQTQEATKITKDICKYFITKVFQLLLIIPPD